jgi:hypothetical protein
MAPHELQNKNVAELRVASFASASGKFLAKFEKLRYWTLVQYSGRQELQCSPYAYQILKETHVTDQFAVEVPGKCPTARAPPVWRWGRAGNLMRHIQDTTPPRREDQTEQKKSISEALHDSSKHYLSSGCECDEFAPAEAR